MQQVQLSGPAGHLRLPEGLGMAGLGGDCGALGERVDPAQQPAEPLAGLTGGGGEVPGQPHAPPVGVGETAGEPDPARLLRGFDPLDRLGRLSGFRFLDRFGSQCRLDLVRAFPLVCPGKAVSRHHRARPPPGS